MKLSIVAGFALTVLATTSVFASPQTTTAPGQPVVLESTYVHAVAAANGTDDINADNQNGAQPFAGRSSSTVIAAANGTDDINADNQNGAQPFASKSSSTVIVADNRKEFGSTYQRY